MPIAERVFLKFIPRLEEKLRIEVNLVFFPWVWPVPAASPYVDYVCERERGEADGREQRTRRKLEKKRS